MTEPIDQLAELRDKIYYECKKHARIDLYGDSLIAAEVAYEFYASKIQEGKHRWEEAEHFWNDLVNEQDERIKELEAALTEIYDAYVSVPAKMYVFTVENIVRAALSKTNEAPYNSWRDMPSEPLNQDSMEEKK